MKLEKGKVYKCYHKDGSYRLFFSNEKDLYPYNDFSGPIYPISEFDKVEPYEPEAVDTLQEVVEWCLIEGHAVMIKEGGIWVSDAGNGSSLWVETSIEDIKSEINRKSKELTELKALAEKLGYNLSKKD